MKTIVEMIFGSHLYGTSTMSSDMDFKAIHIPSKRDIVLGRVSDVITRNTKADVRAKNTAGDTDCESYSLQKFLSLAAEGQTVALDMLFAPEWAWLKANTMEDEINQAIWREIRANKDKLLTSKYSSFVGYCRTQANKYGIKGSRMGEARLAVVFFEAAIAQYGPQMKLSEIAGNVSLFIHGKDHCSVIDIPQRGMEGTMKHIEVCNRKMPFHSTLKRCLDVYKSLFEEYGSRARAAESNSGIDWKALSHAVRIGRQAIEVLQTGHVQFRRPDAVHLLNIKQGKLPYKDVAAEIEELLPRIEAEAARSCLRAEPDREWIDDFVYRIYSCAV